MEMIQLEAPQNIEFSKSSIFAEKRQKKIKLHCEQIFVFDTTEFQIMLKN